VTWLLAPDDAAVEKAVHKLPSRRFRRIRLVSLNGGYALHRERYRSLQRFAEEEIQRRWRNLLTEVSLGRRWVHNLIRNLALLPSSRDVAELRSERPVVVAAAGPSLEASLPFLERYRSRLTIVAVDTAARPLERAGLTADAVVALDGQWANLQDFVGLRTEGTRFITELAGYPSIPRAAGSRRWFFSTDFAPLGLLSRLAAAGLRPKVASARGSVGITAAETAIALADRQDAPLPVFLVGLDLAFDPLHTHMRGSTLMEWSLRNGCRLNPQPAWHLAHRQPLVSRRDVAGRPVMTTSVLLGYAAQLGEVARGRAHVLDARRAGLPLEVPRIDEGDAAQLLSRYASDRPPFATSEGRMHPNEGAALREGTVGQEGAASQDGTDRFGRVAGSDGSSRFARTALLDFISGELTRLERAHAVTDAAFQRPKRGGLSAEELERIRQVDYTWLHFPDSLSEDPSFLVRLRPAVQEYRRLFTHVYDALRDSREL
jgi:hypothetical protein